MIINVRELGHEQVVCAARDAVRDWALEQEVKNKATRVVSELAANLVRHGEGGTLEIVETDAGLEMISTDDGPGMDVETFKPGTGFRVMRELADVEIESSPQGTRVRCVVKNG
jgi:anti-sigma regulatory factor (Ser/Thr protein kinase)